MVRSIAAIISGFMTMVAGVSVATIIAARLMLGSVVVSSSVQPSAAYLVVNLIYSFAFAFLGGYVAGAVARRKPVLHAALLAVLLLVLGFISALRPSPQQPSWYMPVIALGGFAFSIAGGLARSGQSRKPSLATSSE